MFPVTYKDTYFQADYGKNWLKNITMKNASEIASIRDFASGFTAIVCVTENPLDGSLVVVDLGASAVKKISYGGNQPPVIIMNVLQNYGPSPLSVPFQSSYSYDPEGYPLSFSWNFGDGSPLSTAANPTHDFTTLNSYPKPFLVTLTATDQQNATSTKSVIVSVNNTPPVVNINSPVKNSLYTIGADTLYSLAATVTDAEHSGSQLTYEWQTIQIHHFQAVITISFLWMII